MKRASVALALLAVCVVIALLARREHDEAEPSARPATHGSGADALPLFEAGEAAAAPQTVAIAPPSMTVVALDEQPSTTLVVHHADESPARGAVVAMVVRDDVTWSEVTDDEGLVRGTAVGGPAVAWVGGATLGPVAFPMPDARGPHVLTLPAGDVIDGRVVVDDGPPPEPVPLWLTPAAKDDVPPSAREALSPWRPGHPRLEFSNDGDFGALVGGDGSFRFSGLPTGWEGRLNVPYTWAAMDENQLAVRAPVHGLVIALHRIPHLRFRVVTEGARAPAAYAAADVTRSGAGNINEDRFVCDADGRADVPLVRWEPTLQVTLDLANAEGSARAHVQRDLQDSSHDVDFGDIELSSRASIRFHVTEPGGAPVAGAIAATECETLIRSDGTDVSGLGRLDGVPPDCTEMRVGAARHEPALVLLPSALPQEPLEITLERCASLAMRVRSDDGAPRPGVTLRLQTRRHMSAADGKSSFFDQALGMSVHLASGEGSSSGTESVAQPDGSIVQKRTMSARLWKFGDFELGCMEPGEAVSLSLVDDAQTLLWSDEVTLQDGEQRQLEAVVSAHPHPLDVFVSDEAGQALERALVSLRATASDESARWSSPRTTEASGHVVYDSLYTPSVDIRGEKAGYLPATSTGVVPGAPIQLTLRRGAVCTVHVVDGKGRPVVVEGVWGVQGPTMLNGEAVDPNFDDEGGRELSSVYRLQGLAPGTVSVQTRAGGRDFAFEHQASEAEITLVLPDSGALVVRGLHAAKGVEHANLRVGLQGEEKVFLPGWIGLGEIARDEIRWPVVFPGTYRVELVGGDDLHVLAGPAFVEVRIGATAEVSLQ